jgi:hypothetical protein
VDLESPISLLAKAAGMKAACITSAANEKRDEFTATWILLSDNDDFFAQPEVARRVRPPVEKPGMQPWTDDFSSLLPVLQW